jgi:hypothetical protein
MPKLVELYVKIGSEILLNFYITDLTFPIPCFLIASPLYRPGIDGIKITLTF